jgi:hypothetical protein
LLFGCILRQNAILGAFAVGGTPGFAAGNNQGGENLVKRLLLLSGIVLTGMLAIASSAQARDEAAECNGSATGLTIKGDLVVPSGGSCRLNDSTVRGDVRVRSGAYFQATDSTIRGDVYAKRAQTVFIDGGSDVRGNIGTYRTSQVFLFDSTTNGNIDVYRADDRVHVCGMTVQGGIEVERSGTDILIGDPQTIDCAGNLVKRGDIEVENNFTDVELIVRGNTILRGDLEVKNNDGPSDKYVQDNVGGDDVSCRGNDSPFVASGNTGWDKLLGQCD